LKNERAENRASVQQRQNHLNYLTLRNSNYRTKGTVIDTNVIGHRMTTNVERQFNTPLGAVRCGLICGGFDSYVEAKKYKNGESEIVQTTGHLVEIVSFKIKLPLYSHERVTESSGWIFRIEKSNTTNETIETYCLLDKQTDDIRLDTATGEHLDAIQAENLHWTLHIGTEDGEILNSRAEINDWFPPRLENHDNIYQSITEMKQNGFNTKIPHLHAGERIQIQYLTAYDKRDNQKVNTWLAVDHFKRELENWIGLL
jgi:hypothetical protein